MSSTSLLSSLFGSGSKQQRSRSSSMFTKQLSFVKNNSQRKQNRSASVSKAIQNSSSNDLLKWTPLIKTVHKLGAKMKKQYFFFWCRMQAFVKSRKSANQQNRSQNKQPIPICNQLVQQVLEQKSVVSSQINYSQKCLIRQAQRNISKQQDLPKVNNDKIDTNIEYKNHKLQLKNKKQIEQKILACNLKSADQQMKCIPEEKIEIIQKKRNRQNIICQFTIKLSKFYFKFIQNQLKLCSFTNIYRFSHKIQSIRKLALLNFKNHKKTLLTSVLRKLKKHSHQMIKVEILGNTLKAKIKKFKKQILFIVLSNLSEINLLKQKETFFRTKVVEQKLNSKLINENTNQIHILQKKSQAASIKIDAHSYESNKNEVQKTETINIQIHQLIKLTVSPPLTFIRPLLSKFKSKSLKDQPLIKDFKVQNCQERLKKLTRLYPQEPFFQIPDISEITLFNSLITNSSAIFPKRKSAQVQHRKQQYNENKKSNLVKTPEKTFQSNISTDRSDLNKKNSTTFSPKFQERNQQISYSFQEDQVQIMKKSISCADAPRDRQLSERYPKDNYLNTPSSSKKFIDPFSKKKSMQLLSKDYSTNYQTNNSNSKSTLLKKFDLYKDEKQGKKIQLNKKSYTLSSSKQKKSIQRKIQFKKMETQTSQEAFYKKNIGTQIHRSKYTIKSSKQKQNTISSAKITDKYLITSTKKQVNLQKKYPYTSYKKQNQQSNKLFDSSSKKLLKQHKSSKNNIKLSQFNPTGRKVITYNEFMSKCQSKKESNQRQALRQIDTNNQSAFQKIDMTDISYGSKQIEQYQTVSAQLIRDQNENTKSKLKLRSQIDKIELNTARKMKLQIQSMINQRKKPSAFGILKY